jgi:hypothetical protein
MLKEYKSLLPQLRGNSRLFTPNCALTAEAVWKYFNTGAVAPARRDLDGSFRVVGSRGQNITVNGIRRYLSKGGHGGHGVVKARKANGDEHSMNVVNIRGKVYLVDAFDLQKPVLTEKLAESLSYAIRLEYSVNWSLQIAP